MAPTLPAPPWIRMRLSSGDPSPFDRLLRGDCHHGEGGGLDRIHAGRAGRDHAGLGQGELGVAAGEALVGDAEHGIARLQSGHVRPGGHDDPGDVRTERQRQGLRQHAAPARIQASHGPTPAATTRTRTWPAPGDGRSISSSVMTSGGPNRCTRHAAMVADVVAGSSGKMAFMGVLLGWGSVGSGALAARGRAAEQQGGEQGDQQRHAEQGKGVAERHDVGLLPDPECDRDDGLVRAVAGSPPWARKYRR